MYPVPPLRRSAFATGSVKAQSWFRQNPLHEPIKERNCERGVAVGWAEEHAFCDQSVANRRYRRNVSAHPIGDVAGAMRAGTQLGHGTQISPLGRRQTVKPDAEETRIQLGDRLMGGARASSPVIGESPA